jgi:hypothetical protein
MVSRRQEATGRSTRRDPTGPPPALVWAEELLRPEEHPPIVYLDLNHWIGLAKAATGHRDGARYRNALAVARESVRACRVAFVLSSAHYIELSLIADPRQREDLTAVMEELTTFKTIPGRTQVSIIEVNAMVDKLRGVVRSRFTPQLLGYGVGHAFGQDVQFRVQGLVNHEDRAEIEPGLTLLLRIADYRLQRAMLSGPLDSELEDLRRYGWDPEPGRRTTERRLQQELDQVRRFDAESRWRRGRIRDVVSAREYIIELQGTVRQALEKRGFGEKDVIPASREGLRSFLRGMPSSEVAVELKTALHKNGSHVWTTNDIHDIDAMAVAVPYCDVVFTDAAVRARIVDSRIDQRMRCVLPRKVEEFTRVIQEVGERWAIGQDGPAST